MLNIQFLFMWVRHSSKIFLASSMGVPWEQTNEQTKRNWSLYSFPCCLLRSLVLFIQGTLIKKKKASLSKIFCENNKKRDNKMNSFYAYYEAEPEKVQSSQMQSTATPRSTPARQRFRWQQYATSACHWASTQAPHITISQWDLTKVPRTSDAIGQWPQGWGQKEIRLTFMEQETSTRNKTSTTWGLSDSNSG